MIPDICWFPIPWEQYVTMKFKIKGMAISQDKVETKIISCLKIEPLERKSNSLNPRKRVAILYHRPFRYISFHQKQPHIESTMVFLSFSETRL